MTKEQEREIIDAWKFLRTKNMSVPTYIVDIMRDSAIEYVRKTSPEKEIKHLLKLKS